MKPAKLRKKPQIQAPKTDEFVVWNPRPKIPSPFTVQLPAEPTWVVASVTEKSAVFLTWLRDCQAIVDTHFGSQKFVLNIKPIINFLWITMRSTTEDRVFAFISKATGNIHCPAVFDSPFEAAHGNIADPGTRLNCMSAWGVRTTWSWLPTYPNSQHFNKRRD